MYMRYTKEVLEPLVLSSLSVTDVLKKLGKRIDGGTHAHVAKKIKSFGISTSHFIQGPHNKGKRSAQRLSALEYLKSSCIKSHTLKLKLISDGVKKAECEICKNSAWMGNRIPLELDHINGNHYDNTLENLRIVCPNCHAQMPTNAGKNKLLKRKNVS